MATLKDGSSIQVISFDCYGTLIDWRKGVLDALLPILSEYHLEVPGKELFGLFTEADRHYTAGRYITYREILEQTMRWIAGRLGINLFPGDEKLLSESLGKWEAFPDSAMALEKLRNKFRLAVLSNIDDDLLELTSAKLGNPFDEAVTAFQVRSYKPSPGHFREAFDRLGIEKENLLHVAQSIYHDIEPCVELGINCVWINRYNEPIPEVINKNSIQVFSCLDELAEKLLF